MHLHKNICINNLNQACKPSAIHNYLYKTTKNLTYFLNNVEIIFSTPRITVVRVTVV